MRKHPYTQLLERKEHGHQSNQRKGRSKKVLKKPSSVLSQYVIWSYQLENFITQGLERTVPTAARTLLESNVKDEIKHDLALGYIVESHGADPQAELEALRLRDALDTTP